MEGQQLSEEAVEEACYSDSTVDYNYLQEPHNYDHSMPWVNPCRNSHLVTAMGPQCDASDAQEKQSLSSGHDGSTVDASDAQEKQLSGHDESTVDTSERVEEESEEDYVSDSEVDVSTDGEDPEAEYEMVPVMDPAYTGPTYHSQACQVHGVMMMPPRWIYRIMRVGPPKSKKAKTEQ